MSLLEKLSGPAKDTVRSMFLNGPQRYQDLPRDGRGECVDLELVHVAGGEWAYISGAGVDLAVNDMGLATVKLNRKPHERA